MKKRRTSLFFLLPLLYVGVFFLLISLQFSKSEAFSQSFGDLSVSGKAPKKEKAEEILDLTIRGRGLEFFFSGNNPVLIETLDGTIHRARVKNYSIGPKALVVEFQHGLKVFFEYTGTNQRTLSLRPVLSEALESTKRISFPYRADGSAQMTPEAGLPVMLIDKNGSSYFAVLSGGMDRIDENGSFFVLNAQKGRLRTIRIDPAPQGFSAIDYWISRTRAPIDQAALDLIVKTYWNNAYAGWDRTRFHPENVVWDQGDSSSSFTEPLVTAYLSEARQRGSYQEAYDKVQPGIGSHTERWGYKAMPYLGDLVGSLRAKKRDMEVLSSQEEIDFSGRLDLVRDSYYYGPDGLFDRVRKALQKETFPENLQERLYWLANLVNLREFQGDFGFETVFREQMMRILPHAVRTEAGVFLQNESGFLDLKAGILFGRVLLRYGSISDNDKMDSFARELIASGLKQAGGGGILPEVLLYGTEGALEKEGSLLPESVYEILADPAALPREISLKEHWGDRSYLRTVAKVVHLSINKEEARITFEFPVGFSHHFILGGLGPYDHIRLHDIRWRTDPEFQQYSDGWLYNESSRTLYVKLKHRDVREEFVLRFAPEQP